MKILIALASLLIIILAASAYLFKTAAMYEYKREVFQTCINNTNITNKDAMTSCIQIVNMLEKGI